MPLAPAPRRGHDRRIDPSLAPGEPTSSVGHQPHGRPLGACAQWPCKGVVCGLSSLFAFAAGLPVIRSGVLPRSLGRVLILVGILLFLQGFGLGGVIATFGLARDLIGSVLLLVVVLVSSVILLTRKNAIPNTAVRIK
jgi:hypothetical protein